VAVTLVQLGDLADTRVAGSGGEEVDGRVGGQAHGEGMLTPAGPDQKYAHDGRSYRRRLSARHTAAFRTSRSRTVA